MSRNSRIRRTAAVLAVAAVLATGCGGGDSGSDSGSGDMDSAMTSSSAPAATEESSAAEEPAGESGTIAVSSVDFGYELEEDSFSPGTYEITLTNTGSASHDLVVERDGEDVAASDVIGPGETATFEVTLEEGEYVFYCSVGNHRGMGMEVPVEVTA